MTIQGGIDSIVTQRKDIGNLVSLSHAIDYYKPAQTVRWLYDGMPSITVMMLGGCKLLGKWSSLEAYSTTYIGHE